MGSKCSSLSSLSSTSISDIQQDKTHNAVIKDMDKYKNKKSINNVIIDKDKDKDNNDSKLYDINYIQSP